MGASRTYAGLERSGKRPRWILGRMKALYRLPRSGVCFGFVYLSSDANGLGAARVGTDGGSWHHPNFSIRSSTSAL